METATLILTSKSQVTEESTHSNFTCNLGDPLHLDPTKSWFLKLNSLTMSTMVDRIISSERKIDFCFASLTALGGHWGLRCEVTLDMLMLDAIKPTDLISYMETLVAEVVGINHKWDITKTWSEASQDGRKKSVAWEEKGRTMFWLKHFVTPRIKNGQLEFALRDDNPFLREYDISKGQVRVPESLNHIISMPWKVDPLLYPVFLPFTPEDQDKDRWTFMWFTSEGEEEVPFDANFYSLTHVQRLSFNPLKELSVVKVKCNIGAPSLSFRDYTLYTLPLAHILENVPLLNKCFTYETDKPMWVPCNTGIGGGSFTSLHVSLTTAADIPLRIHPGGTPTSLSLQLVGLPI